MTLKTFSQNRRFRELGISRMISPKRILLGWMVLGLLSGLLVVPLLASGEEVAEESDLVEAISEQTPDLVVTQLEVPRNPKARKRISIRVTVANVGEDNYPTAVSSVTVSVHFGGGQVLFELPLLEAGEEISKNIKFTFASGQWYDIVAIVDPHNDVGESNEDNNQISQRVKVSRAEKSPPRATPEEDKGGCGCGG